MLDLQIKTIGGYCMLLLPKLSITNCFRNIPQNKSNTLDKVNADVVVSTVKIKSYKKKGVEPKA